MTQCTGILEAHGRRWRCTRLAAKKYHGKLCGSCASMRPRQCRADVNGKVRHSALCATSDEPCNLAASVTEGVTKGTQT